MEDVDFLEAGEGEANFIAQTNSPKSMNRPPNQQLHEMRKQFKPGFQNIEKTKEYVERHYYNNKNKENSKLIKANIFWLEYAEHLVKTRSTQNFLSEKIIFALKNHTEMIFALAVSDISNLDTKYKMTTLKGRNLQLEANKHNLLIFWKEISEKPSNFQGAISISQKFFNPDDKYRTLDSDPGIQIEKPVDEFIIDTVYVSNIVITNCQISPQEFQILYEIPEGALPIKTLDYQKNMNLTIQPYSTEQIEFYFYFPKIGNFAIYPANVSQNGVIIARAACEQKFNVKSTRTVFEKEKFTDLLEIGNKQDILQFLKDKNLHDDKLFKFEYIYWLLGDKKYYLDIIDILDFKGIYEEIVWEYAFLHQDFQRMQEYMQKFKNAHFTRNSILYYQNQTFEFNAFQLFEYYPLLSNRCHSFMSDIQKQKNQKRSNSQYLLVWCYYLLLQERIEEASEIFTKISEKEVINCQIQYDYMSSYLDMYTGYPNFYRCRKVSEKYLEYPVISWRNLFIELQNQLFEYDGNELEQEDYVQDTEYSKNLQVTSTEASFNFVVRDNQITIDHQNMSEIEISYHILDLEIMFSNHPFLFQTSQNQQSDQQKQFACTLPNFKQKIELKNTQEIIKTNVQFPDLVKDKNLFILFSSENSSKNITYFSQKLNVQVLEYYGQVKVMDPANKSLSGVYVKVYQMEINGGGSKFWRDGYTDMNGKFEYAQSSAGDIDQVKQFSILVQCDEYGGVIRQVGKPNQRGKIKN